MTTFEFGEAPVSRRDPFATYWGHELVAEGKPVIDSLDKAIHSISRGMGLATDDLAAATTAIKDPATAVERDSLGRIIKFLGRIAVHAPLTVAPNTTAAVLQLRNQQIDVTLLFIAQQERSLITEGVTLDQIQQLRTRLVEAKLNIARACIELLAPVHAPAIESSRASSSEEPSVGDDDAASSAPAAYSSLDEEGPLAPAPAPARRVLSPADKRTLCTILNRSRFSLDLAKRDQLVEASTKLSEAVAADSSLGRPLEDIQQYVFAKLAKKERHQNRDRAVESFDRAKAILSDEANELRFEHGSFVAKARGGFVAWLERFLGWVGSSKESRDAASLLLSDLEKEAARLMPVDGDPDSDAVRGFFNEFIVPLHDNEWFQGTLKHNPDLRAKFAQTNAPALRVMLDAEMDRPIAASGLERLRALAQREGCVTAWKQYGVRTSPGLAVGFDQRLQGIALQQREALTQILERVTDFLQQVLPHPEFERDLRLIEANIAEIRGSVNHRMAVECGCEEAMQHITERRQILLNAYQDQQALMGRDGFFARVEAAAATGTNPIEDLNAFRTILARMYTFLSETTDGRRRVVDPADLEYAIRICQMLEGLLHNMSFGAAVGTQGAVAFRQLYLDFVALRERIIERQPPPAMPPVPFDESQRPILEAAAAPVAARTPLIEVDEDHDEEPPTHDEVHPPEAL